MRDPRAAIHGMAELWEKSSNKVDLSMAQDCSDMATRWVDWCERGRGGGLFVVHGVGAGLA